MNKKRSVPALLSIGLLASCVPPDETGEYSTEISEIIEGYDTTVTDHPWQVSLQRGGGHYCGGSILSDRWIITAKHCATHAAASYQIAIGVTRQSDVGTIGQLLNVDSIVTHPTRDVAMMHLSTAINLTPSAVSTIQIATQNDARANLTAPGVYSSATGWGWINSAGDTPDILQEADMPIIANYVANQIFSDGIGSTVDADEISTGYPGINRQGPCHGDSGGPLTVANAQGTGPLLAGLVSWGQGGCASDDYPVIYVRVSDFEDWIRDQMGCAAEDPGGVSYCTPSCPCGAGKADCDTDADCMEGTTCAQNVGASYGYAATIDVCVPPAMALPNGDLGHCSATNPCAIGHGDCDSDRECLPGLVCKDNIGPSYGFGATVDVCERGCTSGVPGGTAFASASCPGGHGEADCDSDAQCAAGLFCNFNVGAKYGYDPTWDVCESRNLLTNPTADSGTTSWNGNGTRGTATMASGKTTFYIQSTAATSANFYQDVTLPSGVTGKYLVFIGYGRTALAVPSSITRHPYLYGHEMNASNTILTYLQGQNMLHTATTGRWQTMSGIFQISTGATKIRFFMNQASQVGDPPDNTRASFDDLGLVLFDTLAEAQEYRDYYTTTHPVLLE